MFLSLHARPHRPRLGPIAVLSGFLAGMVLGALIAPSSRTIEVPPMRPHAAREAVTAASAIRAAYPAEILRVLDGDTFEARVRIWPGHDVTTKVRLRGIDAPEMKARCEDERIKAVAARDALARLLAQGGVAISHVKLDKYGGRVDANASTAAVADIGVALLGAGHARSYDAGRRQSWCGVSG